MGGPAKEWVNPGSVEQFWQVNKIIINKRKK
jgi:hypothetical protein